MINADKLYEKFPILKKEKKLKESKFLDKGTIIHLGGDFTATDGSGAYGEGEDGKVVKVEETPTVDLYYIELENGKVVPVDVNLVKKEGDKYKTIDIEEESIDPTETSDGEEVKVEGEGKVKGNTEKEATDEDGFDDLESEDDKFAKRAAKVPKEPKKLEDGYIYLINKKGKMLIATWNQFQKEAATWFGGDISQNELTEKGNTAAWLTRIAADKPKFTKQDIVRNGGTDDTEKQIIPYVEKFN